MKSKHKKLKNDVFKCWPLLSSAECMFCDNTFKWETGYGWQASNRHCSYSCNECSDSLQDFDNKITEYLENRMKNRPSPPGPPPAPKARKIHPLIN